MYRRGGAKVSHGLGGSLSRQTRARGDAPSARLAAARAWEGLWAHGVKRGVIRTVAGVVTGSA